MLHLGKTLSCCAIAATTSFTTLSAEDKLFDLVAAEVPPGGEMFGYVELDGDFEALGAWAADFYMAAAQSSQGELPAIPLDGAQIMRILGLGQVQALGFGAREIEDGLYESRSFMALHEGKPAGLMSVVGTSNFEFAAAKSAPANADIVIDA